MQPGTTINSPVFKITSGGDAAPGLFPGGLQNMTIRTFKSADCDGVVTLWNRCFNYPAPHNLPEDSIRRKTALDDGLFFVAVEEESGGETRILGTVMAGWDGHRGWIYSLAVAEEMRNMGIGEKLMNQAIGALEARDCPKVNLQVMPGNSQVTGFYEKLGFVCEERTSMGRKLYRES